MSRKVFLGTIGCCWQLSISWVVASAETLTEYSAESRFQLDLHVPDAVLATYLPRDGLRTRRRKVRQKMRTCARFLLTA